MDFFSKLIAVVLKIKSPIQISGLIILIAGFIIVYSYDPSAVTAQILAGSIGGSFIILTFIFQSLTHIPEGQRAVLVIVIFTLFLSFNAFAVNIVFSAFSKEYKLLDSGGSKGKLDEFSSIPDHETAKSIAMKTIKSDVFMVDYVKYGGNDYIVAHVNGLIYDDGLKDAKNVNPDHIGKIFVLRRFGNYWEIKWSYEEYCGDSNMIYEHQWMELVTIDEIPYVFFQLKEGGSGGGGVGYYLYSIPNEKCFFFSTRGAYIGVDRVGLDEVYRNFEPDLFPAISDFFQKVLIEDDFAGPGTYEEADVYNPENASELWDIQNGHLFKMDSFGVKASLMTTEKISLKVKNYSSNLFEIYTASVIDSTANDRFTVISYFKGPVYAHDKINDQYFVVFWSGNPYADSHFTELDNKSPDVIKIFERGLAEPSYCYEIDLSNHQIWNCKNI